MSRIVVFFLSVCSTEPSTWSNVSSFWEWFRYSHYRHHKVLYSVFAVVLTYCIIKSYFRSVFLWRIFLFNLVASIIKLNSRQFAVFFKNFWQQDVVWRGQSCIKWALKCSFVLPTSLLRSAILTWRHSFEKQQKEIILFFWVAMQWSSFQLSKSKGPFSFWRCTTMLINYKYWQIFSVLFRENAFGFKCTSYPSFSVVNHPIDCAVTSPQSTQWLNFIAAIIHKWKTLSVWNHWQP